MNRTKSWITSRPSVIGLAFFVGAVGLGVAHEKMSANNPPASLKLADAHDGPSRNSYAPVLKSVLPAVVNISSSRVVRARSESPEEMMPFFRQFFGGEDGDGSFALPQPRDHREKSLGSGVVVSPEGYILTNNHVVDGATDVRVTLSDKRELQGRVVGTDPKTDIAVLKIEASNLFPITIGDSSKAEVGDTVLAIGDPFGVGETVTKGIVSATGRGNLGIEDYEDFIQTDAPINPGNSGGVLVGDVSPNSPAQAAGLRRGDIILEVNSKPMTNSNQLRMTISMMQPGSEAKLKVVHDGSQRELTIKLHELPTEQAENNNETGDQQQASAGIEVANLTPNIAQQLNLPPTTTGVVVKHVNPSSPLADSGLREGDVVQEVNHQPVKNVSDFYKAMHKDATNPLLLVNRGGRTLFITA